MDPTLSLFCYLNADLSLAVQGAPGWPAPFLGGAREARSGGAGRRSHRIGQNRTGQNRTAQDRSF